jgi:hypothetical protein
MMVSSEEDCEVESGSDGMVGSLRREGSSTGGEEAAYE